MGSGTIRTFFYSTWLSIFLTGVSQPCLAKPKACSALYLGSGIASAVSTRPPDLSRLMDLDGQVALRKAVDAGKFEDSEDFIYSYHTKRDIQKYMKISTLFRERLSPEQSKTLSIYWGKGGWYGSINTFFRVDVGLSDRIPSRPKKSRVSPEIAPMAKIMDSIFERGDILPEGFILFRGLSFENKMKLPRVGQRFTETQFLSASMDPEVARNFASTDNWAEHKVIYMIRIGPEPLPVIFPGNERETEIILPRKTIFEVVSKRKDKGYTIIEVVTRGQAQVRD